MNHTQPAFNVVAEADVCEGAVGGVSFDINKGRDEKQLNSNVDAPGRTRPRSISDPGSDDKDAGCKGGPGKMICGEQVKDGEPGVRCDVCMHWFHSVCQAIPKAAHSALQRFEILSWICAECKLSLTKPKDTDHLSQFLVLESKVDHIENMVKENLQKIQASMAEHVQAAKAQSKHVEQTMQAVEHQKGSYAQAVKGTCNDMVKLVTAKIDAIPKPVQHKHSVNTAEEISGVFDNFLDKEKRKSNLVVHNLEESSGANNAGTLEQDVKKFVDVVKKGLWMNVKVSKAFRVGKGSPTKPRLLIVSMENVETKVEILKRARDLRHIPELSNIYITPDLTWKEREDGKKLREELARRRDSGESNLIIRRGKIVQLTTPQDATSSLSHAQQDSAPPAVGVLARPTVDSRRAVDADPPSQVRLEVSTARVILPTVDSGEAGLPTPTGEAAAQIHLNPMGIQVVEQVTTVTAPVHQTAETGATRHSVDADQGVGSNSA